MHTYFIIFRKQKDVEFNLFTNQIFHEQKDIEFNLFTNQIFHEQKDAEEFARKSKKRGQEFKVVEYTQENLDDYWYTK